MNAARPHSGSCWRRPRELRALNAYNVHVAPYILLCAVATLGLVLAEWNASVIGKCVSKPLASIGFVLTAIAGGATSHAYGMMILCALLFCLVGDVLLLPDSRPAFVTGLASFLVGHLVFASAFLTRGTDRAWMACALLVLVPLALLVMRWLRPHLRGAMRFAVMAYVLAIVVMSSTAAGTFGARGDWRVLAGAVAFLVSDLAVARDRFVRHARINRVVGLPLYYAAQLLLASSVRFPA